MKKWTDAEKEYLESQWGIKSIPSIAKKLGKSVNAIRTKAYKMGLGRHIHSGEYITYNQLLGALGQGKSGGYKRELFLKNNIPVKEKISVESPYLIIYIDDFWKWAEKNKNIIDFTQFEVGMLGKEPEWVEHIRKVDYMTKKYKTSPWTPDEDSLLVSLLNAYKYGYKELSHRLMRTEGAIKKRMVDLGLKQRPLKANIKRWSEEEIDIVVELYYKSYSPELIAEKLETRSALAVKGMIERLQEIEIL